MNRTIAICMMLALGLLASSMVQAQHYYGGGNVIPLTIDSSKLLVARVAHCSAVGVDPTRDGWATLVVTHVLGSMCNLCSRLYSALSSGIEHRQQQGCQILEGRPVSLPGLSHDRCFKSTTVAP